MNQRYNAMATALLASLVAFAANGVQADEALSDVELPASGYQAGKSYFGANRCIEYIAGDGPLIVVAPHGGHVVPEGIPMRVPRPRGDANSQEYARGLAREFLALTGKHAHVIVNHIPKQYFSVTDDRETASRGYPRLMACWDSFHGYIEAAKAKAIGDWGAGHYLECHTRGGGRKIDVGLGWTGKVLDASLEKGAWYLKSRRNTLRNLVNRPGVDLLEAVRGGTSLGGLLEGHGYTAIPSPKHPSPGEMPYFLSGKNCWKHGFNESRGAIDATHLEVHWSYIKPDVRPEFEKALADSVVTFLETHYGFKLRSRLPQPRDAGSPGDH